MGLFNKKKKEVISEKIHPIISKEDYEKYNQNQIKKEKLKSDLELYRQIKWIKKTISELDISDSILIEKLNLPEEPKIEIMSFDEFCESLRIEYLIEHKTDIKNTYTSLYQLELFFCGYQGYLLSLKGNYA